MNRLDFYRVEFYITNVCNYNCDNCNRLNNFFFSSHQYWKNYQHVYQVWSEKINFKRINILGGEPLLNPGLIEWITGIREYWPDSNIRLLSNGTRLEFWPQLYDVLNKTKTTLVVCLHNRENYNNYISYLKSQFFNNSKNLQTEYISDVSDIWVETYNAIKGDQWPDCESMEDYYGLPDWIQEECKNFHKVDPENFKANTSNLLISDENDVKVEINYAEDFYTAPLKYKGNNQFVVYNSDPKKAHDVCLHKYCHEFIKGKFYKCPHVGILPEFMQQFNVDISQEDTDLLNSYQPLTSDKTLDEIQNFFKGLHDHMPQCKLCPESLEFRKIQSNTNKIKVLKKKT